MDASVPAHPCRVMTFGHVTGCGQGERWIPTTTTSRGRRFADRSRADWPAVDAPPQPTLEKELPRRRRRGRERRCARFSSQRSGAVATRRPSSRSKATSSRRRTSDRPVAPLIATRRRSGPGGRPAPTYTSCRLPGDRGLDQVPDPTIVRAGAVSWTPRRETTSASRSGRVVVWIVTPAWATSLWKSTTGCGSGGRVPAGY